MAQEDFGKIVSELERRLRTLERSAAGGGAVSDVNYFVPPEVPTGLVNGSNAVFTTSQNFVSGSTMVYRDGQLMKKTDDYFESGANQITFVSAPASSTNILIAYQIQSAAANNADTVDNYHANATPTASNLLPLDSNAQFPVATIPNSSISSAKLASNAVETAKILDGAVTGAKMADTGWVAVTMQNNWVNYDATYGRTDLTFVRKIGNVVFMQGLIKSGASGATAFTLPAGYRPRINLIFATTANSAYSEFRVMNNGAVIPYAAGTSWFSIACCFIADA